MTLYRESSVSSRWGNINNRVLSLSLYVRPRTILVRACESTRRTRFFSKRVVRTFPCICENLCNFFFFNVRDAIACRARKRDVAWRYLLLSFPRASNFLSVYANPKRGVAKKTGSRSKRVSLKRTRRGTRYERALRDEIKGRDCEEKFSRQTEIRFAPGRLSFRKGRRDDYLGDIRRRLSSAYTRCFNLSFFFLFIANAGDKLISLSRSRVSRDNT